MATFNILTALGLAPFNMFPDDGVAPGQETATAKSYTFMVNGQQRSVVVTGTDGGSGTLTAIQTVTLYDADGTTALAEFLNVDNVALSAFEAAWLGDIATPNDVFSLLLTGNSILNGGARDDRFVGGMGNDTINGNSDYINFTTYDYVDYSDRSAGIIVDFVNGNSEDNRATVSIGQEIDTLIGIGGIYATAFNDRLTGDKHDNEFWVGLGNDTIIGGGGFDMIAYNGPETRTKGIVVEFSSEQAGTVIGEEGEADTFSDLEAVYGSNFGDSFKGAEGYQRFRGFAGDDTFDGAAGDDEVDYRSDTRQVDGAIGIVVDLTSVQQDGSVLVQGVNGDIDKLISIELVRGSRNNDNIRGSEVYNRLRGDAGNDVIHGLGGDDRLEGGEGNDIITGGADFDNLFGGNGNDHLHGNDGFDTLDGGAGDDVLIGGIGASVDEDFFIGSSGNDSIFGGDQSNADDPNTNWNDITYNVGGIIGITVTFNDNAAQYGSGTVVKRDVNGNSIGIDTFFSIHAIRGTTGQDTFTGGGSAPQRFVGYAGNDTFDGTNGINEVDYRAEARAINRQTGMSIDLGTEPEATVTDATGHQDTLIAIERVRGTDHNDLVSGNNLDNRLRGDAGNDRLTGRDGNDSLEGGSGFDTLDGGTGNDILVGGIGNATDEDYFFGSKGSDTIFGGDRLADQNDDGLQGWNDIDYCGSEVSGIKVTFADNPARYGTGSVEKLDGSGTDTFYNIHAVRGTNAADQFIGGDNPDPSIAQRFIGYAGADIFDGTKGINEIDYRAEARVINRQTGMTIDLGAGLEATVTDATGQQDTLKSIERVRGTDHADRISGNGLNNRLRGDAGNDVLMGRNGDDRLEGGIGDDTAAYAGNRSDYHVTNSGTQLVIADLRSGGEGTDTVIDVEFFKFGETTLNIAQVINHGSAVSLTNGMVFENSKAGEDVGILSVANPDARSNHSFTLTDDAGGRFQLASDGKTIEVKNGLLLDYDQAKTHTVTVRATDQFGKSVDQILTIVLKNRLKENTVGSSTSDTLSGGASTDTLAGGGGNDILDAGGGNDKVDGGVGNDRILGGAGKDLLSGGAGKDVFAFANKDTGTSKGTADTITDFSGRGGDKIDLKLIDADTKKKGDQAFSFVGKNDFTKAGQVRYEKAGKDTYVYINTDSDKTAEGVIKVKGALDMQKSWFVL